MFTASFCGDVPGPADRGRDPGEACQGRHPQDSRAPAPASERHEHAARISYLAEPSPASPVETASEGPPD